MPASCAKNEQAADGVRALATMSETVSPAESTRRSRARSTRDPLHVLRQVGRKLARSSRGQARDAGSSALLGFARTALAALERREPKAAVAPLSALILRLPRGHAAAAAAHAVLAHVHFELGRSRRAILLALEAQRLDPRSSLASIVAERAYAALFPVAR
ncbi:MAG: hypothetical protein JW751_28950 [Polyangiaceae bacterium]|nr:hypothetical protein [Polyangiaceae bacterium]